MTDSPIATLLQQHLSGVDISDQLNDLVQSDPQLAPMAQLLTRRDQQLPAQAESGQDNEALEAELVFGDRDELMEQQSRDIKQLGRVAQSLRRDLGCMTAEIERLHATLDQVAAALGGCPICLGGDPDCALCSGRGTPGALPPDPEAFREIVLPAVHAYSYRRSRTVRGRAQPDNGERSA